MSALSALAASTAQAPEVPSKRLYKSTTKFLNVIMEKGEMLRFKHGMYITDSPKEIAYLDEQIASGAFNGSIYIDPNARTISAEQENPMLALRKKFFAEFLAEQAAHLNPENDMGSSVQSPLKAASTSDIASVALGAGPVNMVQATK
jgi:hypothetical protein